MKMNRKVILSILIFVVLSLVGPGRIQAESVRHRFSGDENELGVIIGEPTGLSYKGWTGRNTAFDVGVAWSFRREGNLHIHADYLIHNFSFFDVDDERMPYYIGIGGRVKIENHSRVGVRFVIGTEYYLEDAPFGFFFEIAPILDLAPETELDMNGAIGARVVF
ncbi:MAG: hypothetical protein JW746_09875 [Candidatus Krumholzibacteriota bacterium]|nr:hypothetical protein [Candidatus Krumholzibacteriota bacterium]